MQFLHNRIAIITSAQVDNIILYKSHNKRATRFSPNDIALYLVNQTIAFEFS